MRSNILAATVALLLFTSLATVGQAQTPGVDMPLHTGVYSYNPGHDDFVAGSVRIAHYVLLIERTFDPMNSGAEIQVSMELSGPVAVAWPDPPQGGPVEYPSRARRYQKEDFFYNAVDWRPLTSVPQPVVYVQKALVSWPAGYGEYTGVWYPAGSTVLDLTITVR